MVARLVVLALFVLAALPSGASAAESIRLKDCPADKDLRCGTLEVPLDRTGAVPGTVTLRVVSRRGPDEARKRGLLVALAGGPGQAATPFAARFVSEALPLLDRRRLVVIDQRGTGRSGAISCPPLQRASLLEPFALTAVAGCATRLGPAAGSYATRDTVEDLEAVRVAFGAKKLALLGLSYGTYVAQQYARVHPDRTELLVLDSVVSGDGGDPFAVDTISRVRRVLGEQCARGRCRGASSDPYGDLTKVAGTVLAGGLRGKVPDRSGRLRTVRLRSGVELLYTVVAGDLNPFVQAAIPGALAAAADGDFAPLLRLKRPAAGGRQPTRESSAGLFTATICSDAALPFGLDQPLAEREAATDAAIDQLDPASYAPFDRQTLKDAGSTVQCYGWPVEPRALPSTDALPDVPALLLNGRLDLRTPHENARDVAVQLPRASQVMVSGTGHDVLGSDETGCADRALRRFAQGRRVGWPCRGRTNAMQAMPRPATGLGAFRSAPGVPGRRGQVVFALLDTVGDADTASLQLALSGIEQRGGCLRRGWFVAGAAGLSLHGCSMVPGLRLTGRLELRARGLAGRLRVDGPGRLDGLVRLGADGSVRGRLGGRRVGFAAGRARAAASADLAPRGGGPYARELRERLAARGAGGSGPDGAGLGRAGRAHLVALRALAGQQAQAALHRRVARPRR